MHSNLSLITTNHFSRALLNHKQKINKWKYKASSHMSSTAIEQLAQNQLPAIYIDNFLSPKECQSLRKIINQKYFSHYPDITPAIEKLGITQFELFNNKEKYFEEASKQYVIQKEIFLAAGIDPIKKLMFYLENNTELSLKLAQEDGKNYYAGIIRKISNSAKLHYDYAPMEASSWSNQSISSQISWNIVLSAPTTGGDCTIHNKQAQEHHKKFKYPSSYHYSHKLVQYSESLTIRPKIGRLYLFNSRNYHEVKESTGVRYTLSSFLGTTSSQNTLYWS